MKFAKSLNQQSVKQIKKVMIYIREREDQLEDSCKQLKEIIVKTLAAHPNSTIYREFLTFFREIFYYNKDMDQVDYQLACDSLEVLNSLLKSSLQTKETLAIKGNTPFNNLHIQDYFQFSDMSPGLIVSDTFKIPQENFTIALLFKVNTAQVLAYQERTGKQDLQLTFFSI